ncbi:uncharacterized protein LOC135376168 [Ornithodoros turicata]|uniref:uncharacterized protein LOC135376168 n=1 Tax=Ornithodoros turicata TaxID=34597 RepID=UPI00313A0EDC
MEGLRPPDPLLLSGNVADNWRKFKQRLELYLEATEVEEKPRTGKRKIATLLHVAGPDAVEVFNTFSLTAEERASYTTLLQKFEAYCTPKCNETYERYVFRCRMQNEGEPFEAFYRDVQLRAQSCNFSTLTDSFIRDQIVYGVWDGNLRERLLREYNLTFSSAVQLCKAAELTEKHNRAWNRSEKVVEPVMKREQPKINRKCGKCGRKHEIKKCLAYGKVCRQCKRKNHFAACCRAIRKVTDGVYFEERADSGDDFDVLEVGNSKDNGDDWLVTASVSGRDLQLKVDTGSQANLIPHSVYRKISAGVPTKPAAAVPCNYSDGIISHVGTAQLLTKVNGIESTVELFVTKSPRRAILGLKACRLFGLVKSVNAVASALQLKDPVASLYSNLFQGVGC